ncbi:hypothetical protein ACLMJK_000593 [Lecanora helva]
MASPTSHPHSQKQAAASHLTPVSASSPPAPPSSHSGTNRSVPSPAYSAALKSTHRSLHNRNGSANIPTGGTPRAGPTNGTPRPGTTSAAASPAANAAAAMLMDGQFGIPPTVGIGSGFTPRGVGLTPVAMQLTASQGGISATAAALDQEEERKRRIENIVGMMATKWGFVSQDGVERCARRLGLECLWEESMGEERKRMLTIAGHGVLVDVEFRGEEVRKVGLQFEGSRESVVGGAGAASEVLKWNLQGDGEAGYVLLDGFAGNLERLAGMDRLGGSEVNCFDAVEGIRQSLQRVHDWEAGKANDRPEEGAAIEVMCQQSGRPRIHTRGRVGLALQYWLDRRLVSEKKTSPDAMEIDTDTTTADEDEDDASIWSTIMECEASPAELYPPIRISDDWVSEAVEKAALTDPSAILADASSIDWQEPPPTLLSPKSPTNGAEGLEIDIALQPKSPDVHFVAKFEPPVIVPLQIAIQIHESVGSPLPQESLLPTTFENLLFTDIDPPNSIPLSPRTAETTSTFYDPKTNISKSHRHKYTLFTQPNDYARAITHLPFSHPRQIVALLPSLRQWILTAAILRRCFIAEVDPPDFTSPLLTSRSDNLNGTASHHQADSSTQSSHKFQFLEAELADFLSSPLPNNEINASTTNGASSNTVEKTRSIDITLLTSPQPRFSIQFPNPSHGGKLTHLAFTVGLNGAIENVEFSEGDALNGLANGSMHLDSGDDTQMKEKVKKVLEISESIGVAVDWVIGSGSGSTPTHDRDPP